jgi:succinate dehydrogenase/fumarate reductase-like Fe-S protein
MAEYTPGPWEVLTYVGWGPPKKGDWCGSIENAEGERVYHGAASFNAVPRLADALLIAASPDMHAALEAQAARDAHGRWNCTSCLCDDVECSVAAELETTAIRLREEALKKAKGE